MFSCKKYIDVLGVAQKTIICDYKGKVEKWILVGIPPLRPEAGDLSWGIRIEGCRWRATNKTKLHRK